MIASTKSLKAFDDCLATIRDAAELADAMRRADPESLDRIQAADLQALLRLASCSANAMTATHDGRTV